MATKLKIIEDVADIVAAPALPESQGSPGSTPYVGLEFTPAPTRKRQAGWTAERQRTFVERVALTGNVGEACALVGLSSTSFYRLCTKPGAHSFVQACKAARVLAAGARGSAIAWDRAINGRVERFYRNGELVMERRIPSDYLLTWLLARLDPLTFGSPAAKAHALAHGDPHEQSRKDLPGLMEALTDVPPEECECDSGEYIDERLGEMADGKVAPDEEPWG
jgi:hypothetical protein